MKQKSKALVPFFHVDAFTDKPFAGNPAAVCQMSCDLDDKTYLSVSREMNLSETAFFQSRGHGKEFRLRWFTPLTEVPLCGHATLATAHVIFSHLKSEADEIYFHTLSGVISAKKVDKGIRLDFPSERPC